MSYTTVVTDDLCDVMTVHIWAMSTREESKGLLCQFDQFDNLLPTKPTTRLWWWEWYEIRKTLLVWVSCQIIGANTAVCRGSLIFSAALCVMTYWMGKVFITTCYNNAIVCIIKVLTTFFAWLFHNLRFALLMWIPTKTLGANTEIVWCGILVSILDAFCFLVCGFGYHWWVTRDYFFSKMTI